jgi:SAM-dependent methyltransferase
MKELDYTRHYQKWHSDEPEHIRRMIGYFCNLIGNSLPKNKDASILDIGCGMGFAILAAQSLGYTNVEGIEVDNGQVESCITKGLKVQLVSDTINFLTQKDQSYDCIILLDVLEHVKHEEQLSLLKAAYNTLKDSGILICTVPNANSALASRWRYIDWTHHASFTEHSLDFVLYNAGFNEIKILPTEFFYRPSGSYFSWLFSFKKAQIKQHVHWVIFSLFRKKQRLQMIAELGWEQGRNVPLSLNLKAIAKK